MCIMRMGWSSSVAVVRPKVLSRNYSHESLIAKSSINIEFLIDAQDLLCFETLGNSEERQVGEIRRQVLVFLIEFSDSDKI